jgi:hypothetical protein
MFGNHGDQEQNRDRKAVHSQVSQDLGREVVMGNLIVDRLDAGMGLLHVGLPHLNIEPGRLVDLELQPHVPEICVGEEQVLLVLDDLAQTWV